MDFSGQGMSAPSFSGPAQITRPSGALTPQDDDSIWAELLRRVEHIIDGEILRCIELLSLREQSQVARLVRSLLKAQLERAKAASTNAMSVMESWQRVVGPLDSDILDRAKQTGAATTYAATVASSASTSSKPSRNKRRLVEQAPVEDHEEFLQFCEAGDQEAALAKLAACRYPQRFLECSSEGGVTALHHAAFSGDQALSKRLLELRANPDRKTDYGFTALMAAVQSKHILLLSTLLEHRANVNACADYDGRSALHLAAGVGDFEISQALLNARADPKSRDRKGKQPADKARDNNHTELVHLLGLS